MGIKYINLGVNMTDSPSNASWEKLMSYFPKELLVIAIPLIVYIVILVIEE